MIGARRTPLKQQAYPSYKQSSVEWLGLVPSHWGVKRLKDIARLNPSSLHEDTDQDYEIDYVDISGVDPVGRIVASEILRFGEAPSRARRRVKHGDTILSTVRTYLRAISYIAHPPPNLIVSTGFAV